MDLDQLMRMPPPALDDPGRAEWNRRVDAALADQARHLASVAGLARATAIDRGCRASEAKATAILATAATILESVHQGSPGEEMSKKSSGLKSRPRRRARSKTSC